MKQIYDNALELSQQFRHCGNPLRVDSYMGCSFGCKYCFSNNRNMYGLLKNKTKYASINMFQKYKDGTYNDIEQELINNNVPIHMGGMSDPFQHREWNEGITYEILKIFIDYPISISTKTSFLPEKYYDILNPSNKVFQISLFSNNESSIRKWESKTPTYKDRLKFIELLKLKGYFVTIRIQPIIYIEECLSLIKDVNGIVDFITIEHFKLPNKQFIINNYQNIENVGEYKHSRNYYNLTSSIVLKNIKKIKEASKLPIGIGDNRFHHLSDTLNCCGLDLYPQPFINWMKYNSMYLMKSNNKEVYIPQGILTENNMPFHTLRKMKENNIDPNYKNAVDLYMNKRFEYNSNKLF